jgi:hypothetical protein
MTPTRDKHFLTADDLDAAFLGIGRRCGQPYLAVYSIPKATAILRERDGLTAEEARASLESTDIGVWAGDLTPVWVEEMTLDRARWVVDALSIAPRTPYERDDTDPCPSVPPIPYRSDDDA